ncbi:DUF1285 domain-containing protein [Asticcacaulis sp. DW145]|jgi:hypothetical protein|uniref:DUF1285 domain-containing protein n=1 Tax=Asticcacaulis currens TaxID=2984210 RepID=A0ABT5IBM6_9CAUL|nr:DUF1285 domain-containing protein [Asticcacaulis currens]MDC7693585.1 DUF1285 domain-containing protein [Asticcacaulis currens]BEV10445.1 DUF1285 domain-containing protein [Asticcacaulis sp. DW145]
MNGWLNEAARFPDKDYPVESWQPSLCGAIDILIRRDGVWLHEGRPITRPALVRLFSKLLRRDAEGYVLVTPAEKLTLRVEDLPFRIVDFEGSVFRSDQDDPLPLSADHPLVIDVQGEAWLPRLRVRGDLWGRLTRACTARLFETAEMDGGAVRVELGGQRFEIPVVSA